MKAFLALLLLVSVAKLGEGYRSYGHGYHQHHHYQPDDDSSDESDDDHPHHGDWGHGDWGHGDWGHGDWGHGGHHYGYHGHGHDKPWKKPDMSLSPPWLGQEPNQKKPTVNQNSPPPVTQRVSTPPPDPIGECIRNCPVSSEFNPVCGDNNVTYSNEGRFECAKSCGLDISLRARTSCSVAAANDAAFQTSTVPIIETSSESIAAVSEVNGIDTAFGDQVTEEAITNEPYDVRKLAEAGAGIGPANEGDAPQDTSLTTEEERLIPDISSTEGAIPIADILTTAQTQEQNSQDSNPSDPPISPEILNIFTNVPVVE